MSKEVSDFIIELEKYKRKLSEQTIRTIRGQALAGDLIGARKGLKRMLGKE